MCITNMFVDKPCFIIFFGLLALCGLSYLAYDRELFMQTEEIPRMWLIEDDHKLVDYDMQTVAEDYFQEQRASVATELRS